MAAKSKVPIFVALVVVGLLVAVPVGGWLARGTIATSVARGEVERRGFTCDDRFNVSLNATFSEAIVGPTRCEHAGGILEAIELMGDATIELDGTEPSAIQAESLRVVLRDTQVRGGAGWAETLRRINLEQQMASLVKGISELAAMELPDTTVESVEIIRGSRVLGRGQHVVLTPGDPLTMTAQRLHFEAGPMGVGQLDLTELSGTVTTAAVTLRGSAHARAGVAIIFVSERSGPFTLEATALDTAAPRFSLSSSL